MNAHQYRVAPRGHTRADPDTVLGLVSDAERWSDWARPLITRSGWDRLGTPLPDSSGAVRSLGVPGITLREEILQRTPSRQVYTILTPRIFRYYRGTIAWTPILTGGTDVSWSVEYETRLALIGRLLLPAQRWAIGQLLAKLIRAADRTVMAR